MRDRGPGDMYTNLRPSGARFDIESTVHEILTHETARKRNVLIKRVPREHQRTVNRLVEGALRRRLQNG